MNEAQRFEIISDELAPAPQAPKPRTVPREYLSLVLLASEGVTLQNADERFEIIRGLCDEALANT